ncbi:hypothetical protein ACFWOG_29105 [Kitasatospora sp. NPDC058406]
MIGVGTAVTVRYGDGTAESLRISELASALDRTLTTADSPLGHRTATR